jgi:hypothetical protein
MTRRRSTDQVTRENREQDKSREHEGGHQPQRQWWAHDAASQVVSGSGSGGSSGSGSEPQKSN